MSEKKPSDESLEDVVRNYIDELANPSPDAIMRQMYVVKMARMVGKDDPYEFKKRWHEAWDRHKRESGGRS